MESTQRPLSIRLWGIAALVALPVGKWIQVDVVEGWSGADSIRQLLLAAGLTFLAVALYRDTPWWKPALAWQFRVPSRQAPGWRTQLAWTLGPAAVLGVVILALGLVFGFDNRLGEGGTLFGESTAGRITFIAIVIALGEEYLFRGLLVTIALRTRLDRGGLWALSLSFAVWHIPDASSEGLIAVVGTLIAMFFVSHLALYPIRMRSNGIAGVALLHATSNIGLSFISF